MSRRRRTVVYAALVAFTVWPLAHIGLVKGCGVNPWKLAGWGMYAAPQIPPELEVFCRTPDEVGEYPLRTLPDEVQPQAADFLRQRLALGNLVEPRELAAALLDRYPAILGTRIVVVQPLLDPRTGMVFERRAVYEYPRGAVSTP